MESRNRRPRADAFPDEGDSAWASIREALRGLRFGSVNIVIQDGVVVQIDRTEKRRLQRPTPPPDPTTYR